MKVSLLGYVVIEIGHEGVGASGKNFERTAMWKKEDECTKVEYFSVYLKTETSDLNME